MFCKQCGTKNEEDARFCELCGAPMKAQANEAEQTVLMQENVYTESGNFVQENVYTPPQINTYAQVPFDNFGAPVQAKSSKKWIIILVVGIVILVVGGFFIYQIFVNDGNEYETLLTDAQQYLAKNDKKNAETTYLKAIEKASNPDDAYIALSDIYVEQGKIDEAILLLEKGIGETKSQVLSAKLDRVKKTAEKGTTNEADAKDSDSIKIEGKDKTKDKNKDADKIVLENKEANKVTAQNQPPVDPKIPGNSFANISVGGLAVSQNGFTYYRNDGAGGAIYCMKNDGTGKKQLNNGNSYYINVVGEWIYYSFVGDGSYNLYKMKTDGSNQTKLVNHKCYEPKVVDGWIYYINDSDSSTLYKVKTDGSGNKKISTTRCNFVCVKDDVIYYSDRSKNGGGAVCKMNLNGEGKSVIYGKFSEYLNLVGDTLYFTLMEEPGVYSYSIATNSVAQVSGLQNDSLNINNGVMYYSNWSNDDHYLYKMNLNGTGETKLVEEAVNAINVDGEWIYYQLEGTTSVYKVKTDGTQRQSVS